MDEEQSFDARRRELESRVFIAVNELMSYMGCSAGKLPGQINPQLAVYWGTPDDVRALTETK